MKAYGSKYRLGEKCYLPIGRNAKNICLFSELGINRFIKLLNKLSGMRIMVKNDRLAEFIFLCYDLKG